MLTTLFQDVPEVSADAIIAISDAFFKDCRKNKVNMTIGNYLGADGKIPLQSTVEKAESRLLARKAVHSYLPMIGLKGYLRAVERIAFGEQSSVVSQSRVASCQTIGGTGALFLAGVLAQRTLGMVHAVVSAPTWGNHIKLFERAGLTVGKYRYWDAERQSLNFDGMMTDLDALPEKTLVLLQVCCHNPTGLDLSHEQWQRVCEVILRRNLVACLDMAYQGFAQDLESDAYPVRLFADSGVDFMLAVSLSKGFSLYGERVGSLHVVTQNVAERDAVLSQLRRHVRELYSNPPRHGAMIVEEILSDPELERQWRQEVQEMCDRVRQMRIGLAQEGLKQGVNLDFVVRQHGIFSFTGFTPAEMQFLRSKHGVYGIDSGRIAMAGLTEPDLAHVAAAFADVIKQRNQN